jgi:hypothetical protein
MTHLLIAKHGYVLGKSNTRENAQRAGILSRRETYAVSSLDDLKKLPKQTLFDLNQDHDAQSLRVLWAILSKRKYGQVGKVSVKEMLRHIYSEGDAALTQDELVAAIPGATWNMVTTGMSLLKNKKYADGPLLIIEKIDGKYRRRV